MTEPSDIQESLRIREWLLGILRFAITLEPGDRELLMVLAAEMDRLGPEKDGVHLFHQDERKAVRLYCCKT